MLSSLGLPESLAHKIVSKIKVSFREQLFVAERGETGAQEPGRFAFEICKPNN